MERRIALIGFGEAARAFAPELAARLSAYDRKTDVPDTRDAMRAAMAVAGVTPASDTPHAVEEAQAVLSLVTADQALAAATACTGLARGAWWFDMNSVAPQTKRAAAVAVSAAGGRYCDVAVMAPVYPRRTGVPLLVGGEDAQAGAAFLRDLGFADVTVAGDAVGAASAIKDHVRKATPNRPAPAVSTARRSRLARHPRRSRTRDALSLVGRAAPVARCRRGDVAPLDRRRIEAVRTVSRHQTRPSFQGLRPRRLGRGDDTVDHAARRPASQPSPVPPRRCRAAGEARLRPRHRRTPHRQSTRPALPLRRTRARPRRRDRAAPRRGRAPRRNGARCHSPLCRLHLGRLARHLHRPGGGPRHARARALPPVNPDALDWSNTITTPVRRLRDTEARAVLREELDRAGWDSESAFTVRDGRRPETEALAWWHANTPANERSDTLRNLAYLRAYLRITPGGEQLHAGGLFLDRRRLWMDRSVISRLTRDGCLAFHDAVREPWFALTEAGRRYIEKRRA